MTWFIAIFFSMSLTYASDYSCNHNAATNFESFWKSLTTQSSIDQDQLKNAIRCISSQTSQVEATKRKKEIENRYRSMPSVLKGMQYDYPSAIQYRVENEILREDSIIKSLSDVDISSPQTREVFKKKTKLLFDYHQTLNQCIKEDMSRDADYSRLRTGGLGCASSPKLNQLSKEMESTFQAWGKQQQGLNPPIESLRAPPPLGRVKDKLACQAYDELNENRKIIECNAKNYCKTAIPTLEGTRLTARPFEESTLRKNYALNSDCSGVPFVTTCQSEFYIIKENDYALGKNPNRSLASRGIEFFQSSCAIPDNKYVIPQIKPDHFYNTNSASPNHCELNWEQYSKAYQRALIAKLKPNSIYEDGDWITCGSLPRSRTSNGSRGVSPTLKNRSSQ